MFRYPKWADCDCDGNQVEYFLDCGGTASQKALVPFLRVKQPLTKLAFVA